MKTKILSVLLTVAMVLTVFPAFTVWGDDYSITLSLPDGIDFGTFAAWGEIPEGVPCVYPCNALGAMAPQEILATFAPATEGVKLSAEISGVGADGFNFLAIPISSEELGMSVIFRGNVGAPGVRTATVTVTATNETDGSILATKSFDLSYTLEGPTERPPWPLVRRVGSVPIICSASSFVTNMNDVNITSITQSGTTENGFLLTVEGPSIEIDRLSSIDVKSLDVRDGVVYMELRDYNTNIKNIGTTPLTWSVTFEISNEFLGKEIVINGVSWQSDPQTIENLEMTYALSSVPNAVIITLSRPLLDEMLVVAYYEGDKLLGLNATPIQSSTNIKVYGARFTELIPQTATVKAFVWNNFNDIKPICPTKTIGYENGNWVMAD